MDISERSQIRIFLDTDSPFGGKIVRNSCLRRQVEILEPIVSRIDDWIKNQIHRMQVPSDNRPDFRGDPRRFPIPFIVAMLKIDAVEKFSVGGMRRHKQSPNLKPVKGQSASA